MSTTAPAPSASIHYRDALTVGTLELREDTAGKREVEGVAVPYDVDAHIRDFFGEYVERFEAGAVQDSDDALLYWRHEEPIGKITAARDTAAGWEITATISQTPRGDEAYALLKDGVIREFSIGFEPLDHRVEVEEDTDVIVRTKVKVREVSLVPFGAFGKNAPVSQVREATNTKERGADTMADNTTAADLDEVRQSIEDVNRKVDLIPTTTAAPARDNFRSIGDMVKKIAAGDELAIRVYEGATTDDAVLQDAWVGDITEIIKKRRPVLSTFATGTLPSTGLSVEYADVLADTIDVDVQEAEGDDLAFGKVSITTKTADVVTLGGWSSLSRQTIERANVGILDTTWEALAEKYGQRSEAYARAQLTAALAATGGDALAEVEADITTQDGVVAMVLDLAEHFEGVGRALDGVFVDRDTFLALYGVEATKRILQVSGNVEDKVGDITVQTASGSIANLPFKLLPGASAGTVLAYDATALKSLESPGLPFRLQDDNVVNLSRDISLYGYLASFVQKRAGLVKVIEAAG